MAAAQKLKLDRKGKVLDPLPEVYWALMAESAVCAALARTPDVVGFSAGDFLESRERQKVEQRKRFELADRRSPDLGGLVHDHCYDGGER
jgi:hypothetical protein